MKKILLFAAGAALLGMASCGKSDDAQSVNFDNFYSQNRLDSLFDVVSSVQGYNDAKEFEYKVSRDSSLTKKEYMKGFMYAFNADTARAFVEGMQKGLSMAQAVAYYQSMGVNIDKQAFLSGYTKAFNNDNAADSTLRALDAEMQIRWAQFTTALENYENAKIEASPESQANLKRGEAYIDSICKADPDVQRLADGIAIKIDTIGEGQRITESDRIYLTLSARTIDGKAVDSFNNRAVGVSSRTPGLIKGLLMLKEGGVATVYVPGPEACGVNGKRFGIGPNETIIYNVKVNGLYNSDKESTKTNAPKVQAPRKLK